MRLYYMPGACSLAVHIVLREARISFQLERVDYATRRTEGGVDFFTINPKGYVPALALDSGDCLTEVPVILQYLADQAPDYALLPAYGLRRLRALEWLNFAATEIHKSFSPLFRPTTPEPFLVSGRAHLSRRLDFVESHLQEHHYLMGQDYTVADAYLFALCRWLGDQDLAISNWPSLLRHHCDVKVRRAVAAAIAAEGIPIENDKGEEHATHHL